MSRVRKADKEKLKYKITVVTEWKYNECMGCAIKKTESDRPGGLRRTQSMALEDTEELTSHARISVSTDGGNSRGQASKVGKARHVWGSDRVILLESGSYVRCKIHEIVAIDDPSYVV